MGEKLKIISTYIRHGEMCPAVLLIFCFRLSCPMDQLGYGIKNLLQRPRSKMELSAFLKKFLRTLGEVIRKYFRKNETET